MAALIWTLAWLPWVLSASSDLPQPLNMTLTSSYFVHTLRWERGPGTPAGAYYHVTVSSHMGTSWVPVAGCEHIQHPLVCNLTEAFSNQNQVYFTRLTARLGARASLPVYHRGFQPLRDTHLSLPLLSVTPCVQYLCVDLHPPMQHLSEVYDSFTYQLRIKSSVADEAQFFEETKSLTRLSVKNLARGRSYCVSVRFADSLHQRESNYSQPQCASTPSIDTADSLISAVLCVLVISGLVMVALLVSTGSICLRERRLPSVLTSIHHIEEVPLVVPVSPSLSPLLYCNATAPSPGGKRSSQMSNESDGGVTESSAGSRPGNYTLWVSANLVSLSPSSSSCSLSAPLSAGQLASFAPDPPGLCGPQPEAQIPADTSLDTGLKHTPPLSDSVPNAAPADMACSTVEREESREEEEEEEEEEEGGNVNLFTLVLGRCLEEVHEEERTQAEQSEAETPPLEKHDSPPTLPSQPGDSEEGLRETSTVEEEEEEECWYVRR
ncbi:interferon alpha/beta receptor 2-like [Aulostomus maculatus]